MASALQMRAFAKTVPLVTQVATVNTSSLRLRSGPSTSHTTITFAPGGDYVLITGKSGAWYRVSYDLKQGYMHESYLKTYLAKNVELGYGTVTADKVNLRSGPGTSYRSVAQAMSGERAYVIGFNQQWYKVICKDQVCYIRSDYLELTEIPYENSASPNEPIFFVDGKSTGVNQKDICKEALVQLLELSRMLEIPVEFSLNGVLHLTQASLEQQQGMPRLDFHINTILANHGKVVSSLEPYCEMAVEKCNFPYIPPHLHKQAEQLLQGISVSAVWSSDSSMEITHPDAQKGIALEALCGLLDIPPENTMALGDSGNDESMLKKAGLGVAMGNAPDFIKAAADAVTESNENDGAAIAIERWALNL